MSSATRRMRSELAATILAALGSPRGRTRQETEQENISCAEEVLCERIKEMIDQLRALGIANAKIARDLDIDPGAVSEIHTDGWTGRLGLESLWQAYGALVLFTSRAGESLRETGGAGRPAHGELIGFSAHPDRAKVTGSEALGTIGHNLLSALGAEDSVMRPFGPHINGASAVYTKDGYWVWVAIIHPDEWAEMTRAARDEIWHFEQWLGRKDKLSAKPKKLKSAF